MKTFDKNIFYVLEKTSDKRNHLYHRYYVSGLEKCENRQNITLT